jgi:hypothetical protein
MRSGWLLRDGDVVCALETAETKEERARALRGRDSCEGSLYLPDVRVVHTFGMHFSLDVAFLSEDLTVLRLARVVPRRFILPPRAAHSVVEAQAGSWERWDVTVGDQFDIREVETG